MDSFGARSELAVGSHRYAIYRLDALAPHGLDITHLPYSLRILLENLLRTEDGKAVTADDIRSLAAWDPQAAPETEISFTPARVLLQDFTGVPAIVDLAAMRDAMARLGGDPARINPHAAGRACDRPLGAGRRLRLGGGTAHQRRARVRAQPRALCVPALGPGRVRELQGGATGYGHRAPGQPGVPGARRLHERDGRGRRRDARLPGHARGHRLAHDDGERPGRAGLGRRRHRGRGGHARPAGRHAHPAGRRLPAGRGAARRRDRDRPGADGHRDAA